MSFRRSSETGPESARWRIAHRALLLECGIPDDVANSDRRWIYLLLHGSDDFGTKWDVSWITPSQAKRLLDELQKELPSEVAFDLLRELRRRAAEKAK